MKKFLRAIPLIILFLLASGCPKQLVKVDDVLPIDVKVPIDEVKVPIDEIDASVVKNSTFTVNIEPKTDVLCTPQISSNFRFVRCVKDYP